jgi:hypothetical protein
MVGICTFMPRIDILYVYLYAWYIHVWLVCVPLCLVYTCMVGMCTFMPGIHMYGWYVYLYAWYIHVWLVCLFSCLRYSFIYVTQITSPFKLDHNDYNNFGMAIVVNAF